MKKYGPPDDAGLPGGSLLYGPFAKSGFSFKIKACSKFFRRHMVNIPRIKF
ncbi:MAG: hypothetical protein OEL83_03770 [Desulforhopalus sp.]|nr:hypothetical protein [Desulforhopalus sp.]